MIIYGSKYIKLQNDYIPELVPYKVISSSLPYNNIKAILMNDIKDVTNIGTNSYKVLFDRDVFYKGILGDIECFYIRTLMQYINITRSRDLMSNCWNIVSQYYLNFFAVTSFLRFLFTGNIYLTSDEAKCIESVIMTITTQPISINSGNYLFMTNETAWGDIEVEITKSSRDSHEQTWISLSNFINQIALHPNKDDESTIYESLKQICISYKPNFVSSLRNMINYQPIYGYNSLCNSFRYYAPRFNLEDNISELLCFNNDADLNYKIKISSIYGNFFFHLVNKLYSNYIERSRPDSYLLRLKRQYLSNSGINVPETITWHNK